MRRTFLGTVSGFLLRSRTYLAADAIEIDEIEGYTGTRRRVLLDEVLLVTLDRRRSWWGVGIWGTLGTAILAAVLLTDSGPGGPLVGSILAAPFLIVAAVLAVAGTDTVTIFGKRGVAQVAYRLRKGRAREVFALVRDRAQQAQQQVRADDGPALSGDGSASVA